MTRTRLKCFLVFVALAAATGAARAEMELFGNAARGEKLHAKHCTTCHDTRLYTRPDRRVKSREGLMAQLDICNSNLNTRFNNEQVDDIVKYLNDQYYKLK